MEKAFSLNAEGWLAHENAKWERWLKKWHKNANLLFKGASWHEAAELYWCQMLWGWKEGKKMMRCVEREEIPEADSMPRFTSMLGGRPALVYVSGFILRKV